MPAVGSKITVGFLGSDGKPAKYVIDANLVEMGDGSSLENKINSLGSSSIEVYSSIDQMPDDLKQNVTYWIPNASGKSYDVYTYNGENLVPAGEITVDLASYIKEDAVLDSKSDIYGDIYIDESGKLKAVVPTSIGEGGSTDVVVTDTDDGVVITVNGEDHTVKNGTSVKSVTSEQSADGNYTTVTLHSGEEGTGDAIGHFNVAKGERGETGAVMKPASAVTADGKLTFSAEGEESVEVDLSAVKTKVTDSYSATSSEAMSGKAVAEAVDAKQDKLVSGQTLATINGQSLLSGNNISTSELSNDVAITLTVPSNNSGSNKAISSTGFYFSTSGSSLRIANIARYRGKKIKIKTSSASEAYLYAIYRGTYNGNVYKTCVEENLLLICENKKESDDVIDLPMDATSVVVKFKSADETRVLYQENILLSLQESATKRKNLGEQENFYNAFLFALEIGVVMDVDILTYTDGDGLQEYSYYGEATDDKLLIDNWVPSDRNTDKTVYHKSVGYDDVTSGSHTYRYFNFNIKAGGDCLRNVRYLVGIVTYSGSCEAYDANGLMIASNGNGTSGGEEMQIMPEAVKFRYCIRTDVGANASVTEAYIKITNGSQILSVKDRAVNSVGINSDGEIYYVGSNPKRFKIASGLRLKGRMILASTANFSHTVNVRYVIKSLAGEVKEKNLLSENQIGSSSGRYKYAFAFDSDEEVLLYVPLLFSSQTDNFADAYSTTEFFWGTEEEYKSIRKKRDVVVWNLGDSTSSTAYGKVVDAATSEGRQGAWVSFFNDIVKPKAFINGAVGGYTLSDTNGSIKGGVIVGASRSYIAELESLVERYQNGEVPKPDYLFITGCTNDENPSNGKRYDEVDGDYDETMEGRYMIDSDDRLVNVNSVDFGKIAGAIRYIVERTGTLFPNLKWVIVTPLRNNSTSQKAQRACVRDMEWMANRLSIPVIDVFREAQMPFLWDGTNSEGEVVHHWLADAYHPYAENYITPGADRHGKFIAKRFLDILDYESDFNVTFAEN